jgi:hypothetical protein
LLLPTSTVSVSLGCTVMACTCASAGRPSVACCHRPLPASWRNKPTWPPSIERTAPAYTCVVPAMLASPVTLELRRGSYACGGHWQIRSHAVP